MCPQTRWKFCPKTYGQPPPLNSIILLRLSQPKTIVLTWIHQSAVAERIALIAGRARTHSDMILHLAVGICAALADARVHAVSIMTSLAKATFYMIGTFTSAAISEWISAVPGWTRADGTSAKGLLANGIGAAGIAGATLSW